MHDERQLIARHGYSRAWLVQSDASFSAEQKPVKYMLVQRPDLPPCTIDLSSTKLHGKVYSDGEFGCLKFSPDGSHLAFVAEQYRPKPKSFLDTSDDAEGRGDQFLSLPDWGEQLTGKHKSVVVVVPVDGDGTKDSDRVMMTPPEWCAGIGQLQWTGPQELVAVAYVDASPRLGLIYCPIREAVLLHVSLTEKKFTELTPRGEWVGSPRLDPTGEALVYLRGPVGGPHVREAQLVSRPWGPQPLLDIVPPAVVIDYHQEEQVLQDGSLFAGLTGASVVPERCFLAPHQLVFSTTARFATQTYVVDIKSKLVEALKAPLTGSVTALDVADGRVLLGHSTLTVSASLHLLPKMYPCICIPLVDGCRLAEVAEDWLDTWLLADPPSHPDPAYNSVPVPVLYCGPTQPTAGAKRPLVSLLHGGPHSAYTNSFYMLVGALVGAGYSVVMPNYRGSLGVGAAGIHSLPGYVGSLDTGDCHAAVLECLKRYNSVLDERNVFLCGGSHGGFLVTSLAGQYPDFYCAVSTRNPVTDVATMASITDIPDCLLRVHVYPDCHPLRKVDVEVDTLIHTINWFEQHKR
ncbi:acylamino-acid-releasing enzyme-like [Hyalella azteca]|uniref:acylaminoacyl-peptidase n=1 Tax=Hyalella azteca TaxID=294128 RepID=A0A979FI40_HYAAZ|nr:acylamino-acid-releasing enzyme-like [Hyalella azteca]